MKILTVYIEANDFFRNSQGNKGRQKKLNLSGMQQEIPVAVMYVVISQSFLKNLVAFSFVVSGQNF